jgi:hypothetical protein
MEICLFVSYLPGLVKCNDKTRAILTEAFHFITKLLRVLMKCDSETILKY